MLSSVHKICNINYIVRFYVHVLRFVLTWHTYVFSFVDFASVQYEV